MKQILFCCCSKANIGEFVCKAKNKKTIPRSILILISIKMSKTKCENWKKKGKIKIVELEWEQRDTRNLKRYI